MKLKLSARSRPVKGIRAAPSPGHFRKHAGPSRRDRSTTSRTAPRQRFLLQRLGDVRLPNTAQLQCLRRGAGLEGERLAPNIDDDVPPADAPAGLRDAELRRFPRAMRGAPVAIVRRHAGAGPFATSGFVAFDGDGRLIAV